MITYIILAGFISLIGGVLAFLPVVTTLPFGIDDALSTTMGYWNTFANFLPPLAFLFQMTLWYLGFRVILMGLKLILGHRAPISHKHV